MSIRTRTFLLIPILLFVLACQAVTRPLSNWVIGPSAIPTSILFTSPTLVPIATQAAPTPTSPPSPSPSTTPTPVTPTIHPSDTPTASPTIPSPTPTPTNLPLTLQLEILEDLWTIVDEEYLYTDFNGLDWDAIYAEYRGRIEDGLSNAEFYLAMDEMIARLGDDHSVYLSPEEVASEEAEYAGNLDYVGVGALISAVPERNRAVILVVFPDSPAEQAGLQPRDNILLVDGQPILDEYGFLRDIVRGPEGSTITLTVQTPGDEPREIMVTRRRISGSIPVPYQVLTSPNGKRIGYILLVTFSDGTIDEQVGEALRSMSADAPLDGLIIDNRQNSGGANTVMRPILAYFVNGTLGHFISRQEERPLQILEINDINGSSKVPLVVLIGLDTVSYGEVFSGVLKDVGRAYLIGETTQGNVETLWGYDFADGSRAWIAHESFRPAIHPEEDWEQTGIVPDLTVVVNWDEFTLEKDPAVEAALNYLEGQ